MSYRYLLLGTGADSGAGAPANARITDDGSYRVTDDGSYRVANPSILWALVLAGAMMFASPVEAQPYEIIDLPAATACGGTDTIEIQLAAGGAGSSKSCQIGNLYTGCLDADGDGTCELSTTSTTDNEVVIRANASQTGDVLKVLDSAGVEVLSIDPEVAGPRLNLYSDGSQSPSLRFTQGANWGDYRMNVAEDMEFVTSAGAVNLQFKPANSLSLVIDSVSGVAAYKTFSVRPNGSTVAFTVSTSGVDLADQGTKPTCDSSTRGNIWLDEGGAGVADTVEICTKDSGDAYAWRSMI